MAPSSLASRSTLGVRVDEGLMTGGIGRHFFDQSAERRRRRGRVLEIATLDAGDRQEELLASLGAARLLER
jgi:hypothetical protein